MTAEEITAFLEDTGNDRYAAGLERMRSLMHALGDPQERLHCVHVTGTNGKGSTCAMLASVLQNAGYRTGLYTSPHIFRYNERICVDGIPISDAALGEILEQMRPIVAAMPQKPTTFERITAAAFCYFVRQNCDFVVLEVGLGGRYDATNLISAPEVAVLTPIGLDHTALLGGTVPLIAGEKAGIIKPGCDVVSAAGAEAQVEIDRAAQAAGDEVFSVDCTRVKAAEYLPDRTRVEVSPYGTIDLPLCGVYQTQNLMTAITAIERLQCRGAAITTQNIKDGIAAVRWRGRFECLQTAPYFYLDGAHNPHGIAAVAESLQTYFPRRRIVFLLGALADKDVDAMLSVLLPMAAAFVTVTPPSARAMAADALREKITARGAFAEACDSALAAVGRAIRLAGRDGVVCALGSLYFSGDVRKAVAAQNGSEEEKCTKVR